MKTLKHEKIYSRGYRTMADVITRLPHFLETIYHNNRQHSVFNYWSVDAFEAEHVRTILPGRIATR